MVFNNSKGSLSRLHFFYEEDSTEITMTHTWVYHLLALLWIWHISLNYVRDIWPYHHLDANAYSPIFIISHLICNSLMPLSNPPFFMALRFWGLAYDVPNRCAWIVSKPLCFDVWLIVNCKESIPQCIIQDGFGAHPLPLENILTNLWCSLISFSWGCSFRPRGVPLLGP